MKDCKLKPQTADEELIEILSAISNPCALPRGYRLPLSMSSRKPAANTNVH